MKKILFISPQPFFQWRGTPIRVSFNLLALCKLGYQVDLLTLPIGEEREVPGVRIIRVANPFGIKNIPIGPSLWKLFFDALILIKGLSLCLKNRYDVIHGVEEAGFIGAILARVFKARAIFEKHSDPFSYKKGVLKNLFLLVYARVEKLTVKMASAVICTGPGLSDQVNNMGTPTRAFSITDIPSSLFEPESEHIIKVGNELRQAEDEVLITYVGSFANYQGVDLMFAAIPPVIQNTTNTRFVIIGGDPAEIEVRRQILTELGVADRVTFIGKIDPDILPKYLASSDILLSPRVLGVNTPLKILDYMKAGRAIVATDIPSNKLLLDEQTAALAKPEPEAFAEEIISMANDRERREKMGDSLRALHESTYNFDEYCINISECYDYALEH